MCKVKDVCRHVVHYCRTKGYSVSNLKLQKLLYLIQAEFLQEKDSSCFVEQIEAWDFGPVVPVAYREYVRYGNLDIAKATLWRRQEDSGPDEMTNDDRKLINTVIDRYADTTAVDLVRLTQQQQPWRDAYIPGKHALIALNAIRKMFGDC